MNKIRFAKLCPSGNPTILVQAEGIPSAERLAVSAKLMHPLHLQAEQVGFINLAACPPRLDMMAGEFCLNATRSLVFMMLEAKCFIPLSGTDDLVGLCSSSGLREPVEVRVKNGKLYHRQGVAECGVVLHLPLEDHTLVQLGKGAMLVHLPGITHLLLDAAVYPCPEEENAIKTEAAYWRSQANLDQADVSGVVWCHRHPAPLDAMLDPAKPTQFWQITPAVHVRDINSTVVETACGSASLAVALANKSPFGESFFQILQPSGEYLRLKADTKSRHPEACSIETIGPVRLIAIGETLID